MERSSLVGVVAALVLSMALSPDARASCNSIPDAESAEIGASQIVAEYDPATQAVLPAFGQIGFKGAFGRMDRIHLIPGLREGFRIQPDGQCVDATERGLILREVPGLPARLNRLATEALAQGVGDDVASNLVVSILTRPERRRTVHALFLGSEEVCDTLDPWIKHIARETDADFIPRCVPRPPKFEHGVGGRFNLRVRLPLDDRLRGPAKVVLTPILQSPSDYEALLTKIDTGGCASNCPALAEEKALACVDRFYAVLEDGQVVHDPIPCEVAIPPADPSDPNSPHAIGKNDFKKKCDKPVSTLSGLAECEHESDGELDLLGWEDSCGGIHIPFDWADIRKEDDTAVTRVVAGRSATSRAEAGKLSDQERIWIPGREFLGSTAWADANGVMGTNDWRKTDIAVWYTTDPDPPVEIGLRGTVDQDDSIVHVFPRMPVTLVCLNGSTVEGCMGVKDGGGVSCECGDRYPANCVCHIAAPPQLFECKGGDFEGMPCTRHAHCNSAFGSSKPDGSCSQKPKCQPPNQGGVWKGSPSTGPHECWDDDDCPGALTCGHRLFDLKDRKVPVLVTPPGTSVVEVIVLDSKIDQGDRPRSGVCDKDRKLLCNETTPCPKPPATPEDKGPCRGFTLQAEGKAP